MKRDQPDTTTLQVNSSLLMSGAVLVGVGSLVGLIGLALGAVAVADVARQWVSQQEMPPGELARQQLAKARAATAAGASTWRTHHAASPAHRS